MSAAVHQLDPEIGEPPKPAHPEVFVRAVTTPPGPPWEQARVARLEARHGAPLPLTELLHKVRRLDRWAPGRPGRYAALYVRRREYREPFEATVEVDGAPVRVAFGPPARQLARLQGSAVLLALLVVGGGVLGVGGMIALQVRSDAAARLELAETRAAGKLAAAQAARARADDMRDLRVLAGHARPAGDLVGELTWLATSKRPEARLSAVHWEAGLLAVEARGEQAPFMAVDRPIERSAKPIRPDVWLWGIGARTSGAAGPRPVAAEMAR